MVIKIIEVMYVIDCFTAETPHGKSLWTNQNVLSLIRFVALNQLLKIKICHMVVSEHPEVIGGRRRLIDMDIPDSEDGSIDDDGDDLDEEDESCSREAGARTGVTEVFKKDTEEVQWAVKYSSLSSYMLKTPSLPTQGFKENNKAQEKLFNHICNFGARAEWRNSRRAVSSYLDVEIRKISIPPDQYNPFGLHHRLHNGGLCWW